MAFIDRYTLLKWKEAFSNLTESLASTSPKTRLVLAGSLLGVLLVAISLSLMFSAEQTPPSAPDRTLTARDTQGDQWTLQYLPGQDGAAIQAAAAKPGPPLSLTLRFQLKSPNLLILPELTGAAGEKYYPAAVKNGTWQPPPKLTITDSGGRLLQRGQFEFG